MHRLSPCELLHAKTSAFDLFLSSITGLGWRDQLQGKLSCSGALWTRPPPPPPPPPFPGSEKIGPSLDLIHMVCRSEATNDMQQQPRKGLQSRKWQTMSRMTLERSTSSCIPWQMDLRSRSPCWRPLGRHAPLQPSSLLLFSLVSIPACVPGCLCALASLRSNGPS